MEKYKVKKNGGYKYLYHYGTKVASVNPKGKMLGVTKYFKDFKKLIK